MKTELWVCDDCGESDGLAATTKVRQNQVNGLWIITGDIDIDWCDNCDLEKPRCTLKEIN